MNGSSPLDLTNPSKTPPASPNTRRSNDRRPAFDYFGRSGVAIDRHLAVRGPEELLWTG